MLLSTKVLQGVVALDSCVSDRVLVNSKKFFFMQPVFCYFYITRKNVFHIFLFKKKIFHRNSLFQFHITSLFFSHVAITDCRKLKVHLRLVPNATHTKFHANLFSNSRVTEVRIWSTIFALISCKLCKEPIIILNTRFEVFTAANILSSEKHFEVMRSLTHNFVSHLQN